MLNQQTLRGHWNEIRDRLKEKWNDLSDEDLRRFEGDLDQLVARIQRKTGAAREQIEDYLEGILVEASTRWDQVAESAGAYLQQASEALSAQYEQIADDIRQRLEGAEEFVRRRPMESAALIFGAGIVAGVLLSVWFRKR
jgi:uncharacterized protein YjbJ (UPF0337 family)